MKKITNPLFFKLTKGEHYFYLLGTRHGGVSLDELPDTVLESAAKATTFVKEMKASGLYTQETNESMQARRAVSKEGPVFDWFTSLDASNQAEFMTMWENRLAKFFPQGFDPKTLNLWAAIQCMHTADDMGAHLVNNRALGMDDAIESRYYLQNVREATLVTLDKPISVFHDFSDDYETLLGFSSVNRLTNALPTKEPIEEISYTADLIDADLYRTGKLDEYLIDYYDLFSRNQAWMPKLLAAAKHSKGDTFAFVGAYHLGSNQGLLKKLIDEGYQVTRLGKNNTFENCIYSYPKLLPAYHFVCHYSGMAMAYLKEKFGKAPEIDQFFQDQHEYEMFLKEDADEEYLDRCNQLINDFEISTLCTGEYTDEQIEPSIQILSNLRDELCTVTSERPCSERDEFERKIHSTFAAIKQEISKLPKVQYQDERNAAAVLTEYDDEASTAFYERCNSVLNHAGTTMATGEYTDEQLAPENALLVSLGQQLITTAYEKPQAEWEGFELTMHRKLAEMKERVLFSPSLNFESIN